MAIINSICRNTHGLKALEAFKPSRCTRTLTADRVYVKVTPTSRHRRQGRKSMAYDIVYVIDGAEYPIHIGSKNEGMVFICSLLRALIGMPLLRAELETKNPSAWLLEVFKMLFPSQDVDFRAWTLKLIENKQHLSQASSQVTRKIEHALWSVPKEVKDLCVLHHEKVKGHNTTAYYFNLQPEQIILTDEMLEFAVQKPIRA